MHHEHDLRINNFFFYIIFVMLVKKKNLRSMNVVVKSWEIYYKAKYSSTNKTKNYLNFN